ncbi:hypothetical protein Droror1_Dr00005549 [Drosera rotundifolia]
MIFSRPLTLSYTAFSSLSHTLPSPLTRLPSHSQTLSHPNLSHTNPLNQSSPPPSEEKKRSESLCLTHARGIKLADASKKLGKKFAIGASVVKVCLRCWVDKQRTDMYMRPFLLNVFFSKKFIIAKVMHRSTSKVISVATTNAKALRNFFAVEDEPRRDERIEGKLLYIIMSATVISIARHSRTNLSKLFPSAYMYM